METKFEPGHNIIKYILETFHYGDDISIPIIQRRCHIGYNSALNIFENLVEEGLIERGEVPKG